MWFSFSSLEAFKSRDQETNTPEYAMFSLPEHNNEIIFLPAMSFKKDGWLMCNACGLPQYMHSGCCFDSDCEEPYTYRIDQGCLHCGFPLLGELSPSDFDVEAGKQDMEENYQQIHTQHPSREDEREEALQQYAEGE